MLELTLNGKTETLAEGALNDAMRRYWDAKQSGDTSASLVKVDHTLPEDFSRTDERAPVLMEVPPADPGTVGKRPIVSTTPHGQLSVVATARIEAQERVLTAAGFALPPPVFAPGTRVLELGDDNFRVERTKVEQLPTFTEASGVLLARVGSERRKDIRVPLKELVLTPEGTLWRAGDEYLIEADAFGQLCALGGFGCGAKYLSECCPPPLRAHNVNAQLEVAEPRDAVLRTRLSRGGRSVFAVVSPSYAAVDGPNALARVAPALADARAEVVYDGKTTTATALWMPDQVVDLAAGDVFKIGIRVECEDTGRGRIRIAAVVWRNLCLNLIIVAEGESEVASLVHRGDPERIFGKLPGFVETARSKVSSFLDAWGYARTLKIEVEGTLKTWVEDRRVLVRGEHDRASVLESLVAAWRKEPGDTLADAVNAVTRAAHETPSWGHEVRRELERQAGQLVYVRR